MAISVDYVVRETATNLRRNLLMTSAAVLTIMISLALVGGALLLRQGVNKATLQWRGGVELSIYMPPEVTEAQRDGILGELKKMPEVKRVDFVDQREAFEEFNEMFADQPEFLQNVQEADLPPSFRVVPREAEFAEDIGERFEKRPGVSDVVYAKETVDTLLKVTGVLQLLIGGLAAVLLLSATLLILNTIRMAIFARRREVAVMKLVGATNWFIRIPFMLEGLVQGMVGAAAAFGAIAIGNHFAGGFIKSFPLFESFAVDGQDVMFTGIALLVVGALVGSIGSLIAVSRFLDV